MPRFETINNLKGSIRYWIEEAEGKIEEGIQSKKEGEEFEKNFLMS